MASANLIHRFESKLDTRAAALGAQLGAQKAALGTQVAPMCAHRTKMVRELHAHKVEMITEMGAIKTRLMLINWGICFILGCIGGAALAFGILGALPN